jgi:ABC-2 type transport system permease protein
VDRGSLLAWADLAGARDVAHRYAGKLTMSGFALYWRYVAISIRSEMLYRLSFQLRLASQFLLTIIEFAGVWVLFARFKHVHGWTFGEVAMFYAVASLAFAIADCLSRGFDNVGPMFVRTGNFDRILLRPRTTELQITANDFALSSLGRLAQGAVAGAIAWALLRPSWGLGEMLLLLWSIAGGACLFFSLKMLEGTLSFWTVEGLEVANTLTYGGEAAAQYPLDIYAAWFRKFLIYFVPIACSLYFPVALVLGHDTGVPAWFAVIAPATGFAFLAVSLSLWRIGVRHYTSTGS